MNIEFLFFFFFFPWELRCHWPARWNVCAGSVRAAGADCERRAAGYEQRWPPNGRPLSRRVALRVIGQSGAMFEHAAAISHFTSGYSLFLSSLYKHVLFTPFNIGDILRQCWCSAARDVGRISANPLCLLRHTVIACCVFFIPFI